MLLEAALFLDKDKLLAVPDHYLDAKGSYADRIRLIDSSSGGRSSRLAI